MLEPSGNTGGMRHLLPFEAQLCEALGITPDEYAYFQQLTDSYNGERSKEYELVPDINNWEVVAVVSLVLGLASTALSIVLAPKPRAPQIRAAAAQQQQDAPPQISTANVTGATRFTTNTGFDSIQQLASLGETIPLVFANRSGSTGGVRVKTVLLWSQLLSKNVGQELKALLLLSLGRLAEDPDFEGLAIGDQTLKNYSSAKLAVYRRLNGGRIIRADKYSEGTLTRNPSNDVFSVFDDSDEEYKRWFSGTRSPSTQIQFGCYNPMVNGTAYRLQYELVLAYRGQGTDERIRNEANTKKDKLNQNWATRAGFVSGSGNAVGTIYRYRISGSKENADRYAPWRLDDVNVSTEDRRVIADTQIQLGNLYMAGTAQVVCTAISSDQVWKLDTSKTFTFKIVESGRILTNSSITTAKRAPYLEILQRLAIGTIANTRTCDITEIGLKSTVWKQIAGFPNVNSQPSASTISYYEEKGGSIQLGTINRYHKRISFFRLQIRRLGISNDAWTDLTDNKLFAVEGNTPQAKYNFIRIAHPSGQYEFRFVPYPGAGVIRNFLNRAVYFLGGSVAQRFAVGDYAVTFNGYLKALTADAVTNPDWVVGAQPVAPGGIIQSISPLSIGPARPTETYIGTERESYRDERYELTASSTCPLARNAWVEWKQNQCGHPRNSHSEYWDGISGGGVGNQKGSLRYTHRYRPYNSRYEVVAYEAYSIYRDSYRDVTRERTRYQAPTGTQTVGVSGGTGSGATVRVQRYSNGRYEYTLVNAGTGYTPADRLTVTALGRTQTLSITTDATNYTTNSLNIYDAVADIGKYDVERMSHMDNPEHQIVYVNEQIEQTTAPAYNNLALLGLRLNASREWSSFAQLSAYIKKGIVVRRLIDDSGNPTTTLVGPTNNFAEIAYALLTDNRFGAGTAIGADAVDRDRMTIAARYCRANNFTWDGVIANPLNLRDFIYENAGYCLLDFTILGGQFSLIPTATYNPNNFRIDKDRAVAIKALFTDGNIRNLKVSWLDSEERRLFKAVVKYREEKTNGFPQEKIISVRLSNAQGGSDADPEENFDMSNFCTRRDHALKFAQMALKMRKEVDHGIQFETTPASAIGLLPGEHFRLVSEATHTSRFNNGAILDDGTLVSSTTFSNDNYSVLYWEPGSTSVRTATMQVANGRCNTTRLRGTVFTLANTTTNSRVYKVETLTLTEDGFVEVTASYEPVFAGMQMATLDWLATDFVIEES